MERDLTLDGEYNIQMMFYRIVRLKPIILLTYVTSINSIKIKNKKKGEPFWVTPGQKRTVMLPVVGPPEVSQYSLLYSPASEFRSPGHVVEKCA